MISHAYEFMCDHCGEVMYCIYPLKKSALDEAKANGWMIYKKEYCFCSEECFVKWHQERMEMLEEKVCQ